MTEKQKINNQKYRERHREEIRKRQKEWSENNKEKENERKKIWRNENPNYNKEYYALNSEKIKERVKEYGKISKEKRNSYLRDKYKNNIEHKIKISLRNRINKAINGKIKSNNTIYLLGCSIEDLMKHIEIQFQEGMNWENYGLHGWHIDHIRPCASFNLLNEEEQKACFHYTNLQPLWAEDNLRKGDKLVDKVFDT